ncbi:MAG TPA: phage holin family protein [Terracidiphilus sp.]|jgi:putative membrane protein|nr:phage holin family protein [Terracidiphilus sp.]
MFRLIVHWLLSAIALLIVARVVPGFFITGGAQSALFAALAIGFLNGTLGVVLKVVTYPLTVVTFGLFLLVINASMILFASQFVGGFYVDGWRSAFWGAAVQAILTMIIGIIAKEKA